MFALNIYSNWHLICKAFQNFFMNKLIVCTIAIVFSVVTLKSSAQVMAQKPLWITIKSENLKCWVCKHRMEDYLMKESVTNFESGVAEVKTNVLLGEIKVKYYPDRITPEDIRLIINNAGFDADKEKANADSYKKLPALCKYASEGGGPKKGEPCHVEPD